MNPAAWLALFLFIPLFLLALRVVVRVPGHVHPDDGPARSVGLRSVAGTVLVFVAFAAFARVYLVSDVPQRPGLWLLGSVACAVAAWLLQRRQAAGM